MISYEEYIEHRHYNDYNRFCRELGADPASLLVDSQHRYHTVDGPNEDFLAMIIRLMYMNPSINVGILTSRWSVFHIAILAQLKERPLVFNPVRTCQNRIELQNGSWVRGSDSPSHFRGFSLDCMYVDEEFDDINNGAELALRPTVMHNINNLLFTTVMD